MLRQSNFLYSDPSSLLLSHEVISHFIFLLDFVEIVNNDANKEIDNELTTDNHECYKVEAHNKIVVLLGLHVKASGIYSIVHDTLPALSSHHLKKCHHSVEHVIKIRVLVHPGAPSFHAVIFRDNLQLLIICKSIASEELAFE